MFEKYLSCATSKIRLPFELRTNKQLAFEFCNFLQENKIEIKNSDIFVLASWAGCILNKYTPTPHGTIKSIKILPEEMVGDLTVPDGHSYTANGIIVHNCNLPETATKELVSEIYMKAYDSGCKGFTVYRDKCRDGVLISKEQAESNNKPLLTDSINAPKRPLELPCEIKKVKINGEAWTIFVGLLNNKPYEIFGGLSKYVDIPNKYKAGTIIKNGKVDGISTYNLVVGLDDDQMILKDIANIFENSNFGAFTRTISLTLRHNIPIQFIVEQLIKDKYSEITSFSKVIARVLKSYIQDGTKSSEKKCPECGKDNALIYQEKCLKCINCGFAKC